jgi:4-amino-4-deoxy-L-arabinose transferase-like glycosyltransferase
LAWWAVAVVIAVPQFAFISAAVNNDNLVVALSVWTLAVCVGVLRGVLSWRVGAGALGVLLACAALAKASGLTLYPVAGIMLMWRAWQTRRYRAVVAWGVLWAVAFALIAGWWYARNALELGDASASSWVARATGTRQNFDDLTGELRGLFFSFWGLFGWFNVMPPLAFYALCAGWLALAGARLPFSAVRALRERKTPELLWGLLAWHGLLVVGGWAVFNAQVLAGQGRLFFPLLGAFALAMAWGLLGLPRFVRVGGLGVMLGVCLLLPSAVIAPAYAPQWAEVVPPAVPSFAIREVWNDTPCLTLWVQSLGVQEGALELALFWRAECELTGYWSVFAHWIDPRLETCTAGDTRYILAQTDGMPQGGRLPTVAFPLGRVVRDSARVPLPANPEAHHQLHVGLYDAAVMYWRAFVTPLTDDGKTGVCAPETVLLAP